MFVVVDFFLFMIGIHFFLNFSRVLNCQVVDGVEGPVFLSKSKRNRKEKSYLYYQALLFSLFFDVLIIILEQKKNNCYPPLMKKKRKIVCNGEKNRMLRSTLKKYFVYCDKRLKNYFFLFLFFFFGVNKVQKGGRMVFRKENEFKVGYKNSYARLI